MCICDSCLSLASCLGVPRSWLGESDCPSLWKVRDVCPTVICSSQVDACLSWSQLAVVNDAGINSGIQTSFYTLAFNSLIILFLRDCHISPKVAEPSCLPTGSVWKVFTSLGTLVSVCFRIQSWSGWFILSFAFLIFAFPKWFPGDDQHLCRGSIGYLHLIGDIKYLFTYFVHFICVIWLLKNRFYYWIGEAFHYTWMLNTGKWFLCTCCDNGKASPLCKFKELYWFLYVK